MFRFLGAIVCILGTATLALAQTSAPPPAQAAKLVVTVSDQSGGVIPTATVAIVGLEDANKLPAVTPIRTTDKGIATFEGLKPGRYAIAAEFAGFDPNLLRDVRLKAGENKQSITLSLKRMTDTVTVTQDKQIAGSSRDVLFGSVLTREQIDMLSDDKDEMARQLQDLAGGDATIRVDSFEGQQLPNKSQIKSIRIARDQFAAESHLGGLTFIDIITSPGIGPVRTYLYGGYHNSTMEARNPYAPAKGPAANYNYSASIGGSLIKDRAQFSLGGNRFNSFSTPNLYAATPSGGTQSENLNLRAINDDHGVDGSLDYALTKDQTMRFGFSQSSSSSDNQGVGNYDRLERAFSTKSSYYSMRMTEAGPLGRRMFVNTRFSLTSSDSKAISFSDAQARNVLDAFNEGGAQRKGSTLSRNFAFNSDLDYVRGMHSWRTGVQVGGTRYRTDQMSNYVGTYTFESIAAYNAGTPRSFTEQTGNPNIDYWYLNVGMYIQDDIRVRKNLSLSPGIRYELQTHMSDYNNFSPRFGATWSPFKSGKTTVRGSWGIFYDWVAAGTYLNTLKYDGQHLHEINIINPTFPDPGFVGASTPENLYQYGNTMGLSRTMRVSASANQTLTRRMSVSATFAETRGYNLLVGSNANAPVAGVRPNPAVANIFVTNALGESRGRTLSTSTSFNLARLSTPGVPSAPSSGPSAKVFDWRRNMFVSGSYYVGSSRNDTDGAWSVPASGNLALEWGPSLNDIRHRANVSWSSGAFKNTSVRFSGNWSSAPPINIRTGTDDNGDLIFNDRPAGVGRNSERTASQWNTSMGLSYSLGFGRAAVSLPPGIMITSVGGIMTAAQSTASGPAQPRYRLGISFNINNLTNHRNDSGFSGVITSPFYLKPTTAFGQRSASLNFNLSF